MTKRYGFLCTKYIRTSKGEQHLIAKPIMTNNLASAVAIYEALKKENIKDIEEGRKPTYEIAIFDYEKICYIRNNFVLFRGDEK